jgi:iron complex outermembrane receptor protein
MVTRDPVDPTLNLQIGAQSSQGMELGLTLHPGFGWTVGGNLAVLDAQYDRFNVASGSAVIAYGGNTPPNVPEVVANAWTAYLFPGNVEVGALLRYVGEVQANHANTLQLPEYATLDLFAGYTYKRVEFGLRARNVLDKDYALWSVGDGAQALLGQPLSIEGSVRVRF